MTPSIVISPATNLIASIYEELDRARKYIKRLEADLRDCKEFLLPHRGMDPYSMFTWRGCANDETTGPSPNYAARLYKAIEETLKGES